MAVAGVFMVSPGRSGAARLATLPCGCASVISGGGPDHRVVRQLDRDGWDRVITADEPVNGPPWQGRYAFDPRSFRPATRTSHRREVLAQQGSAAGLLSANRIALALQAADSNGDSNSSNQRQAIHRY